MAPSLADIPDELLTAARTRQFFAWLKDQPTDPYTKARLAAKWSRYTDTQISHSDWQAILQRRPYEST